MAITDYKEWLDGEHIEEAEDMLQVYRPVANNETGWKYKVEPAKGETGNVIVTGGENVLVLTPKSRKAFLEYMNSQYEFGVESQDEFDRAMRKND